MSLRGYIRALCKPSSLDREYVELHAEAARRLAAAILLRDLCPCVETGLLVAECELMVNLVDAARRGDVSEFLALRVAIENIRRALRGPYDPRLSEIKRVAQWN